MTASRGERVRGWSALIACLWLGGCATWSDTFRDVERNITEQRYDDALIAIERQSSNSRDQVLYLLNKAMIQRMAGKFKASNDSFEAAKTLMDELSALSLREQATTFIINDAAHSYVGEEHERVLVHLYEALNYIDLGDLDNARVEALQVDLTLRQFSERSKESQYTEDAFARYLTGMIYEDLGEWSDAMIAYRKSYEAYQKYQTLYSVPPPRALKLDLLRLAEHLGLNNELRRYKKEFATDRWTKLSDWRKQGELILLLHNGMVPLKREKSATVLDPASGHFVRISTPYYLSSAPTVIAARVRVADAQAQSERMEDVQAIALRTLQDKMPAISARAIARAIAKGAIAKATRDAARNKKSGSEALGAALVNLSVEIAGLLTERADTRSWATLPSDIQLARLALAPGTYTVTVDLLGIGDQLVSSVELQNIVINPGRKTYLSRHWTASDATTAWRKP